MNRLAFLIIKFNGNEDSKIKLFIIKNAIKTGLVYQSQYNYLEIVCYFLMKTIELLIS